MSEQFGTTNTVHNGISGANSDCILSTGGCDAATEGYTSWGAIYQGIGLVMISQTTKLVRDITPNATAASTTLLDEADISNIDTTAHNIDINWTTVNGNTHHIFWIIVSESPPSAGGNNVIKALPTETISISETLTPLRNKIRALATQTTTVSETPARLAAKIRALATQATTISEPSLVRIRNKPRAPAAETITIGAGTLTRLAAKVRTATDTISKAETLTRLSAKIRTRSETVSLSESIGRLPTRVRAIIETVNKSESITRLAAKIRTATDTVSKSETITRLLSKKRVASDTITTGETLAKSQTKVRAIIETVSKAETLTRLLAKFRARTETTSISELPARLSAKKRVLGTESIAISSTLTRIKGAVKPITESIITVGAGTLTRLLAKIRTVSDTVTKGETLSRIKSVTRIIPTQSVSQSESISRLIAKVRTLSDTVSKSESISRLLAKTRIISQTISLTDSVDQTTSTIKHVTKILTETINLSETLAKRIAKIRSLTDTISESESISRIKAATRINTESVTITTANLARTLAKIRALSDTVTNGEISLTRILAKIRTKVETVTITDLVDRIPGVGIRHIVRIIDDIDVIVSDFFYKARTLIENISFGDSAGQLKIDNTPTDFVKNLADSITIGVGTIARRTAKKKPISDSTGLTENLAITNRAKKRKTNTETVPITSSLTFFKPQRNITLSLTESISVGENNSKQSGKVRRIGGPG